MAKDSSNSCDSAVFRNICVIWIASHSANVRNDGRKQWIASASYHLTKTTGGNSSLREFNSLNSWQSNI